MAETTSKTETDLSALKTTVSSVSALIAQLQGAIKPAANPTTKPTSEDDETIKETKSSNSDINVLNLAHDSASLIRAHTTKLSLMLINKPFTPTAIMKILRELSSGPLPSLASAVESCQPSQYTQIMRSELQWRVGKLYTEFAALLEIIPKDGKVLNADQKKSGGSSGGKGSLAATGVVWEACDSIMQLKSLGIAGLIIKKAEQYRDTLKDALEELQEWGEETSDDEDDEAHFSDDDEAGGNAAQDAVDDIFGSQRHIPTDDTHQIRPRLESSLRRLKLIVLMYSAVIKRRLKTLPVLPLPVSLIESKAESGADSGIITSLDAVMKVFKKIPDVTDELANAFYELDSKEIDRLMDDVFFQGFAAVELLIQNWEGEKDEFSTWAQKFQAGIKKGW